MERKNFIKDSKLKITNSKIEVDVIENNVRYTKVINNSFQLTQLLQNLNKNYYMTFYKKIGGKKRRDSKLEDHLSFVPIAYGFYFYLVNKQEIPNIQTFCDFFINSFCEKKGNKYHFKPNYSNNKNYYFDRQNLDAKIARAYGSYLREITLLQRLFELQEKNKKYADFDIFYDIQEDILGGADIVIKTKTKTVGLLITQNNKNADYYNNLKQKYRHKYQYDEYIYVKVFENETEKHGDVLIFTENVAKNILDKIFLMK